MVERSNLKAEGSPIKFTYRDYLHLPEDKRYEIIDGELFMVPAPRRGHQEALGNLYVCLRTFVEEKSLGEVYLAPLDVILSDIDIVQPDLLFISRERADILTEENVRGAPDLVIEILSPSGSYRDKVLKRKLYAKYGVREYWIVHPKRREIAVLAPEKGDLRTWKTFREGETLESRLLEGLRIEIDSVLPSRR